MIAAASANVGRRDGWAEPGIEEICGHRQLRQFVKHNQSWLAEHRARIETVASTPVGPRAVVELLAHVSHDDGEVAWPIAVVTESPDDQSVVFRTYCSQWLVDGQRHVRPPILAGGSVHPDDIIGQYQTALSDGDADAILATFGPDGYSCEPIGPRPPRGAGGAPMKPT
jgi:hypothetical protein